jgi:hypothetical protein
VLTSLVSSLLPLLDQDEGIDQHFPDGEKPSNVVSSENAEGAQDDGSAASLRSLFLGAAGSSVAALLTLL